MSRRRLRLLAVTPAVALVGCSGTLSPMRNHAETGVDAYAIFVADGPTKRGELYGVLGRGGATFPLTYTNVAESRPALAPDGGAVAFLRATSLRDTAPGSIWVMNLLNGAERELRLPRGVRPVRVGWTEDGSAIVARTTGGLFRFPAPPRRGKGVPVPVTEQPAAESALAVLLGEPAFARVVPCNGPADLCIAGDSGTSPLARNAYGALRWGPDSVAYFAGDQLVIRPVGPGRPRILGWTQVRPGAREVTYFSGRPRPPA